MKTGSKIFNEKTVYRVNCKIAMLGVDNKIKTESFLITRLSLTVLLFGIIILVSKYGYILAPIIAFIVYFGSEKLLLDYKVNNRSKRLEKEALFFFEIFALTLESGRNIKRSLELTTENVSGELSLEFKKTIDEVRLGKSFNEALEDMKKRIPSDAINTVILNMIESNRMGSNMIDSIYNEIDFLREKEMLNIKAEIVKLPTKVSIISVIFFVPIMIIIILAPVIINYITK